MLVKQLKMKQKNKMEDFLELGNLLTEKGAIRAGEG